MLISYDTKTKVAGVAIVPFNRLGPEKWFEDYRIISYFDWDIGSKPVAHALLAFDPKADLETLSTNSLIKLPQFKQMIVAQHLQDFALMTYRPVASSSQQFLSNSTAQVVGGQYENKVWLRKHLGDVLNFPVFCIATRKDLQSPTSYTKISRQLKASSLVLQHERLSGGKGTYIVDNQQLLDKALDALAANKSVSQKDQYVIARHISDATECSVQAVITKHGVFIGPPQRQIVRHPLLTNQLLPGIDAFCGGSLDSAIGETPPWPHVVKSLQIVAERLQQVGYRGIFGMDFLIGPDETVYPIEVNSRITNMLPLLSRSQHQLPFLLLHLLEKLHTDYQLTTDVDQSITQAAEPCSFLILHNQNQHSQTVSSTLASGWYRWRNNNLELVSSDIHASISDAVLFYNYLSVGQLHKPGHRIGAVFFDEAQPQNGTLHPAAKQIVEHILALTLYN